MPTQNSIRHPQAIPLTLCLNDCLKSLPPAYSLRLICLSAFHIPNKTSVDIFYPTLDKNAQPIKGYIEHSTAHYGSFELCIQFSDSQQIMKMRMLEQQSHIHVYQQQQQRQGRLVNIQQAALEWIEHYAAQFPAECV